MKNIILSTALLLALSSATFAGTKNEDPSLVKDLTSTLQKSAQVSWENKYQFKQASFSFKNKTASAFYSADENELLGFGIQFKANDLPEDITSLIKNKYNDWKITDALMFIDPSGNIDYYTAVTKNNKKMVLKVNPAGRIGFFANMPY